MLGLERKASADQIQAAYFQLAKTWHPDRLPPHLHECKASVASVFAKLNEAHRTLADPKKRDSYLQQLGTGGATGEQKVVARFVDAARAYQRAEAAIKRGSLAEAAQILKECVDADSEPPEYPTMLAWVESQLLNPGSGGDGQVDARLYGKQIEALNAVLSDHPDFERAIFFRAELLSKSGQPDRALRDYRRAVKLNPRNIDAKRAVRLHEMRARSGQGEAADPGLLGRFFRRGKGS